MPLSQSSSPRRAASSRTAVLPGRMYSAPISTTAPLSSRRDQTRPPTRSRASSTVTSAPAPLQLVGRAQPGQPGAGDGDPQAGSHGGRVDHRRAVLVHEARGSARSARAPRSSSSSPVAAASRAAAATSSGGRPRPPVNSGAARRPAIARSTRSGVAGSGTTRRRRAARSRARRPRSRATARRRRRAPPPSSSAPGSAIRSTSTAAPGTASAIRRRVRRAHGGVVADVEHERADVRLVLQRGGRELRRGVPAELAERRHGVVLVGHQPALHDRQAALAQQLLGVVLGEPGGRRCARPRRAAAARSRAGARGRRGAGRGAATRSPLRRPEIAGMPASAKRAAAASSSSSGSVEATITGTGLPPRPAWIPSRTAAQDSSVAPSSPAGWS